MKICYLANADSIHTQRWVNYFARKGHEVHIITLNPGKGYVDGVQIHPLPIPTYHSWPGAALYKALVWIMQTRKIVSRIKPDIIDAHFISTYGYLAITSGFHPVILTAWGSDIYLDPKKSRLLRFITKYVLRRAEIAVCDSEDMKKELLELGTDPAKIRLSYSGVDTGKFCPQPDTHLKEKLGLKGAPVIISTRNLIWVYNIDMLIKAIPLILEHVPQARFIIAGDGDQKDYLQNLATSLGVSEKVIFTGWIPHDELPAYLASSDVYVSTSVSDSIQVSMQEAMACEVAPVVTDLPALRETIIDGENGFLVPVNDFQALADKVAYLLENEEVRKRFGRLGRKLIQERVEYQKEMDKLEKLYQEQAENRKNKEKV